MGRPRLESRAWTCSAASCETEWGSFFMGDVDSLKIKHQRRRELSIVSIPRLKSQEGGRATPQLMVENIFWSHGSPRRVFVPWAFQGPTAGTPCRGYQGVGGGRHATFFDRPLLPACRPAAGRPPWAGKMPALRVTGPRGLTPRRSSFDGQRRFGGQSSGMTSRLFRR